MVTRSRICQKVWAVWVVTYVENTLYSTNKYSCDRGVHRLYISYSVYIYWFIKVLSSYLVGNIEKAAKKIKRVWSVGRDMNPRLS